MTMGSFLRQQGIDPVICEKQTDMGERGHAFLMHTEALSILSGLRTGGGAILPGKSIGQFTLRRPNGEEVNNVLLDSWQCMRRCELTRYLYDLLPAGTIRSGRTFSHFIREEGRVVAAAFTNGAVEYGDLFIGADGGNSSVREALFGKVAMTPVTVKEIVGLYRDKALVQRYAHTFVKFQEAARGLAFGLIPTGEEELVWFIQYDPSIADVKDSSPGKLGTFCRDLLNHFPPVVKSILRGNDYRNTYIWRTRDFDLLDSFHKENVVLLGDAAHLTLPFTSAGTTNAIVDAKVLSECLQQEKDVQTAFRAYHRQRSEVIAKHILLGRQLKAMFLAPEQQQDAPLPFLPGRREATKDQRLRVKYFTDPICSTCWIIQPIWKKLNLEYGHCLDIQYIMGGLLPSWRDCKGKIQSPSDAAVHWKEVGDFYKMPIDAGVWKEDPLSSSFPPSIAFKAAQLQDEDKALLFLRRIREMIFLEKKNIMKWSFLEAAAQEVGLDAAQFRQDYTADARTEFERDLELAAEMEVNSFPTLFFSDANGRRVKLKGYQHYRDFEQAILELAPGAVKREFNREPASLFGHFPTMVDEEFALLSNMMRKDARKLLQQLSNEGYIDKVESQNGVLWKRKTA